MLKLRPRQKLAEEKGQALIEFIMLVPMIMTFVWYLVHVNFAINKSIVGQKHARSQLFLKMYNHRSGPVEAEFGNAVRSHFYVGVAAQVLQGQAVRPLAPIERLGIGPNPKVNPLALDAENEAPLGSMRQDVRIRTVFGICTHRKIVKDSGRQTDFLRFRAGAIKRA